MRNNHSSMWLCNLACFTALACNVKDDDRSATDRTPRTIVADLGGECGEDKPVCTPACTGQNEQCLYTGTTCACAVVCPQDPAQRFCAGKGPNNGCDEGESCNASCECEPTQTCLPDAPVCAGTGPNGGCDEGYDCSAACSCEPHVDTLPRASRSSTVDLTADDRIVAMVNSDEGSVSFFEVGSDAETRLATVPSSRIVTASEPMSVVIHPDGERAFVANRAAGTIARIKDVRTSRPIVDGELVLGGEPIGVALEPTGERLWVTNWVSGVIHVVDTSTLQVVSKLDVGGNPYAIAITNDGDTVSNDEKVLVTQFFGRPRTDILVAEATDDGRNGIVQVFSTEQPTTPAREITLAPLATCFTSPDLTSGCFPNQLQAINIHSAFGKTRAYVVSTAASPRGPLQFNHNLQSLVSVIDVDTELELPAVTTNLNQLISRQVDNDGDDTVGRRFATTPSSIEFVNRDDAAIGYVSAASSDIVLRVVFNDADIVSVGAPSAFNIPAGQNPSGLVLTHRINDARGYAANLISRDLSVLSLSRQTKLRDVVSTAQPQPGTAAFTVWRGKRFFNTSTGIWAREGWGSCQGCHALGLADNVTWQFGAGPRQTISLDGQFASDDPSDMRALNWTAIFDSSADFENNTRGTSGGTGAIRNLAGPITSASGAPFSAVVMEDGVTTENHQNLNGSMKFLIRNKQVCTNVQTCPDWDQLDAYIQTIRSPHGKRGETASIRRGRAVFLEGGCDKCHAGPKWTISRTFYTPELSTGELGERLFEANRARTVPLDASALQDLGIAFNSNIDTTLIAGDDSVGGTPALLRIACNVRNVGTFGAGGGALELRANQSPAQGNSGFNPPSLLGMATSAPYFHNGAAADATALFDSRFEGHTTAGNVNFIPTTRQRQDLTAFLLSIDERTSPFAIIPESVICPLDFSGPNVTYDY
ncbi:MAG: hypothetical protein RL685_5455 [Pseudomonadota bacterium]